MLVSDDVPLDVEGQAPEIVVLDLSPGEGRGR
jgi:hypothetical protein